MMGKVLSDTGFVINCKIVNSKEDIDETENNTSYCLYNYACGLFRGKYSGVDYLFRAQ